MKDVMLMLEIETPSNTLMMTNNDFGTMILTPKTLLMAPNPNYTIHTINTQSIHLTLNLPDHLTDQQSPHSNRCLFTLCRGVTADQSASARAQ